MIKNPNRFQQARPAGFDGVFDWDFLLPAFKGTKIEPMDIDAVVERKGKFLIFETKEPGKEISTGQRITLERLVLLGRGRIVVFVVYGKTPQQIASMEVWKYFQTEGGDQGGCRITQYAPCDAAYVLEHTTNWFHWCNKDAP